MVLKAFRVDNNKVVEIGSSKADETVVGLSKFKKSKNEKSEVQTYIKIKEKPTFLIFSAKKAFNCLRQAFIKVLILQHFDLEYYI